MQGSAYTQYVRSMAEHGERRITEINWLFDSIDNSLRLAHTGILDGRSSKALSSLRHAKNLSGFLRRSLGNIPDKKLRKHLDEFFHYVDRAIDFSIQAPLQNELDEMRVLLAQLHKGWLYLVAPIRGTELEGSATDKALQKL